VLGASRLNLFLGLGRSSKLALLSTCVEVPVAHSWLRPKWGRTGVGPIQPEIRAGNKRNEHNDVRISKSVPRISS